MASILEQLEVKPVPKSRKGVKIAIPKGQVGVKIKIIDRKSRCYVTLTTTWIICSQNGTKTKN